MPNINHHQPQSHHQQQHQLPPHHHMHHQSQAIHHHSDHGPGPFDKVNGQHDLVEVKSKLDAEFRRFGLERHSVTSFDSFYQLLESFHQMKDIPFMVFYTDPTHGDLLPINNDENLAKAISLAKPLLRLFLQRKGESWEQLTLGRGAKKNAGLFGLSSLLPIASASPTKPKLSISLPEDFRQVSQILDVGPLPETCRRVRLIKHGSDRPLGFYIKDGTSVRVTPHGLEKTHGIFISRLLPGGLAEGTGLLAIDDEVLEVNGIEVFGKTLDQVTDMMIANSSNLIIKIRPATQRSLPLPAVSGITNNAFRSSQDSGSPGSRNSHSDESEDEEDEIKDHLASTSNVNAASTSSTTLMSSSSSTTAHGNTSTNPFISSPSSSSYNNNGQSNTSSRKHQQQHQHQRQQQMVLLPQQQHQQQQQQHHLHNQMSSGNFLPHSNSQYNSNEQENYAHQSQSQFSNRNNGMAHQSTSSSSNATSSLLREPPIVSNIEDDLEDDVVTL